MISLFNEAANTENALLLERFIDSKVKGLVLCRAPFPVQRELIKALCENHLTDQCGIIDMSAPVISPAGLQERILKLAAVKNLLLIYNLEQAASRLEMTLEAFLARLNLVRDFFLNFPGTIIFFIAPPTLPQIVRHAFDFYDWMRLMVTFTDEHPQPETDSRLAFHLNVHAQKELDEKIDYLETRLKNFPEPGERAVLLFDLAELYINKNAYQSAGAIITELLSRKPAHPPYLFKLALIYAGQGQMDALNTTLQSECLQTAALNDMRANTLVDIGRLLTNKHNADTVVSFFQESYQLYNELGDKCSAAVVMGDIARILTTKGEIDKALAMHQEELQIFNQLGDQDGIASTLYDLGSLYLKKEDLQAAREALAQAYALFVKLGRLDGICYTGRYLGELLCETGEVPEGREILKQAQEGFARLGQPQMEAEVKGILQRFEA